MRVAHILKINKSEKFTVPHRGNGVRNSSINAPFRTPLWQWGLQITWGIHSIFCTLCTSKIDSTGTPYGVTECDQLEAICGTYNGKYYSWGTGANTDCQCGSTDPISDCFEDNKLYVEDTLAVTMTLEECFKSCQSVTACQVKSHINQLQTHGTLIFEYCNIKE